MTAALSKAPPTDIRRNLYHNGQAGTNFYSNVQYTTVTENVVPLREDATARVDVVENGSMEDSENAMKRRKRADPDIADMPTVRLVEGPSPLVGRLQIHHRGHWRSVCSNSRKYVELRVDFIQRSRR